MWSLFAAALLAHAPPAPVSPAPLTPPTPPGLVDVAAQLPVRLELKYATADNFMKRDVYGAWNRCFLVEDAARMLTEAHRALVALHPELTFVLYDCARPRSVQLTMWDVVKGTPKQGYVADPTKPPGSVHNRGCAVDLGLWDTRAGAPVDMGTPFDFFGKRAEPRHEDELFKKGQLTTSQLGNRKLLRAAMLGAGFRLLPHEWWHFDCAPPSTAARKYPLIE